MRYPQTRMVLASIASSDRSPSTVLVDGFGCSCTERAPPAPRLRSDSATKYLIFSARRKSGNLSAWSAETGPPTRLGRVSVTGLFLCRADLGSRTQPAPTETVLSLRLFFKKISEAVTPPNAETEPSLDSRQDGIADNSARASQPVWAVSGRCAAVKRQFVSTNPGKSRLQPPSRFCKTGSSRTSFVRREPQPR